jgi:hypothetical protein
MSFVISNLISRCSSFNPIFRLRCKLNAIEITDVSMAQWICSHIPARCPFERRIHVFNYSFYIPPLCKLNPFYGEFVELRLRAMTYLMNATLMNATKSVPPTANCESPKLKQGI